MRTARDRLEFALRFAQLDLGTLREGDRLNLRDDLEAFLGWGDKAAPGTLADRGGIVAFPLLPPLPKDLPDAAMKALQAEVRSLLGGVADYHTNARATPEGPLTGSFHPFPVNVRYSVVPLPRAKVSGAILQVKGATRDCTLLVLIHLLTRENTAMIRRCPEDQRLFYRVRRQVYCSRSCVNRVNKRAWRKRQDAAEQKKRRGAR
jgi:hypothetical protein